MNNFINNVKNEQNINDDIAFKSIINKLMQKNAQKNDKLEDIDSYDSESLFNGKLYRGNIYIFQYEAIKPTKYSYNGKDTYFADSLPIVLMTGETESTIRGINLNFCNKSLKTLILNIITNLDEDFYFKQGAAKLAFNKNLVISKKVYEFLSTPKGEQQIIDELKRAYSKVDYSFIFRNYSVKHIKSIRLIEPWQWKYLPFLTYNSFDKGETLKAIQKISGIDNIKI